MNSNRTKIFILIFFLIGVASVYASQLPSGNDQKFANVVASYMSQLIAFAKRDLSLTESGAQTLVQSCKTDIELFLMEYQQKTGSLPDATKIEKRVTSQLIHHIKSKGKWVEIPAAPAVNQQPSSTNSQTQDPQQIPSVNNGAQTSQASTESPSHAQPGSAAPSGDSTSAHATPSNNPQNEGSRSFLTDWFWRHPKTYIAFGTAIIIGIAGYCAYRKIKNKELDDETY